MKKYLHLIVPFGAVVLCSLLVFTTADKKIADLFQRPLKATEENRSVLMINIDDASVDEIGTWPLSRDVYAKTLVVLKELGAASTIFDLSFTDKSPSKFDEKYVKKQLPALIRNDFLRLKERELSVSEAEYNVLENVDKAVIDADENLGQSLKFGQTATLAITLVDYDTFLTEDEKSILLEKGVLSHIEVDNDSVTPEYVSIMPAVDKLMINSFNTGFVNADVDSDGYLRRLHLVLKYDGKYYGQLVLSSILTHYGNPKVRIANDAITLIDAVIERDEQGNAVKKQNIRIPRGEDGRIIIKYPKNVYNKYNQISLWQIYRIHLLENTLVDQMKDMDSHGLFSFTEDNPYEYWKMAADVEAALHDGEDPDYGITYEDYGALKQIMIDALAYCVSDEYRNILLNNAGADVADYINEAIAAADDTLKQYVDSREKMSKRVVNANCILGTTATSTTDWGITQYEEHYPNPGVHYALANMLLSRDFVDDSPAWISILIAFVLCFGYSLVSKKIKGTGRQIVCGIISLILSVLLLLLFFILTRKYIGTVVPVLSVLLTFVITTVFGFLTASNDKKFITNAFSQCLSKEVVNEIVANPSSFKLGGQRLEMTAIFTDIQKFSEFSELLSASQLVALLNYYLTKMSDIIMDERGTVDKYEGDAIIALVGAPVKMDDHGERAVAAALKMKAAEEVMNKEILQFASGEKPVDMDQDLYDAFKIMVQNSRKIFTRIGLNSGEMIAGYMGSENKKNYTMMGNNVNLASRLEGVNKQYSTGGILMSEATRNLLGDRFVVRRLDRVRVVNVNTPIRLYEPLCEKADADEKILKYTEAWEKTMDIFEAKEYDKALECFKKLAAEKPSDKTAAYYISLLENFFCKGKYPVEQDGVGVEYMREDGVFKLLQK